MKFIKYNKYYFVSILIVSIVLLAPFALAEEEFFPLEKVRPGLKGYGYSVFAGTAIEKFQVKVLSLVEGNNGRGKLILVKLSGDSLEESGGLAAGMSGSPVYVKGKLLGAISYGLENADAFLALVTPIESMLNLFRNEPVSYQSKATLSPAAKSLQTPVFVTGMGARSYGLLEKSLELYGLKPLFLPGLGGNSRRKSGPLKPGSAISVQVVEGDYQVSAIGTVTLVKDGNFLAFGHSFLNKGKVDFLASQAHILQTIKSQTMSFKIGLPLSPLGRIVQDRRSGVMGKIGEFPALIPVTVTVTDDDRKLIRESHFQVIHNEQMYKDLIAAGATDAIDQTIDRVGSGTARVNVKMELAGEKTIITRDNIFFGKDIAVSCLQDLRDLLELLATNEYTPAVIKAVNVAVTIKSGQETAKIQRIQAGKSKVKAGESVTLDVILHPFRGENITIPLEVKIPENTEPGKVVFSVRGGSKGLTETDTDSSKKDGSKLDSKKETASLTTMVEEYLKKPFNSQIILEYKLALNQTGKEEEKANKPFELKTDTAFYVLGDSQVTLEILRD